MNSHHKNIKQYLSDLKIALKGQPVGLIQDALYDAENHLLEALNSKPNADINELIGHYGDANDIALQYIRMEQDSQRFINGPSVVNTPLFNGFFEPLCRFKDYKSLAYFFISLPMSIVYFSWLLLFGVPSLLLSFVLVGLPFLTFFLKTQPYLALIEGQLINTLLQVRMPRRPNRISTFPFSTRNLWLTISRTLQAPQGWKIAFYSALNVPLSALYFVLTSLLFLGSLVLMATPIVDPILHAFLPHLSVDLDWYWLPVTSVIGVIGLTLSMHIARALTALHSAIAHYLLIES